MMNDNIARNMLSSQGAMELSYTVASCWSFLKEGTMKKNGREEREK